ncbi:hypothetical protein Fot_20975 [Forsythia ovata]|uniref:Uncharacterized protein n=1 Tax=Forsythia ovata TaxID=205694 RepID=A0ABD1UTJ8_9LAMI
MAAKEKDQNGHNKRSHSKLLSQLQSTLTDGTTIECSVRSPHFHSQPDTTTSISHVEGPIFYSQHGGHGSDQVCEASTLPSIKSKLKRKGATPRRRKKSADTSMSTPTIQATWKNMFDENVFKKKM